jgi:hypothetical protein
VPGTPAGSPECSARSSVPRSLPGVQPIPSPHILLVRVLSYPDSSCTSREWIVKRCHLKSLASHTSSFAHIIAYFPHVMRSIEDQQQYRSGNWALHDQLALDLRTNNPYPAGTRSLVAVQNRDAVNTSGIQGCPFPRPGTKINRLPVLNFHEYVNDRSGC